MATSSVYGKIREDENQDKEVTRRKEVDDLISKYARKKAAPPPPPPSVPAPIPVQRDYSSNSLKYGGGSRENFYGGYGNLYGGASSSNLYQPRRSSQYEVPAYPEPIYEMASSTAPRQQKYLATSKSSSNLYLQPQYGQNDLGGNRSLSRQHKTLSMHGPPQVSNRNNAVMETAASIIANAQQQNTMGNLGTDWWGTNSTYGPAPLQHDWSQKNLWNPAPSFQPPPPPPAAASLGLPASLPVPFFEKPPKLHLCSPICVSSACLN